MCDMSVILKLTVNIAAYGSDKIWTAELCQVSNWELDRMRFAWQWSRILTLKIYMNGIFPASV